MFVMEHTSYQWKLFRSGVPQAQAQGSCEPGALRAWDDLEDREQALGIEPGRPFLLRPDLAPDVDVLLYFASPRFRLLAPQSQLGYANNIRVFLSYLESQGVDWREAAEDHLLNYEYRRRRRPLKDQVAISGAAFARELAALHHFFGWEQDRGVIQESPVKAEVVPPARRDHGHHSSTPALKRALVEREVAPSRRIPRLEERGPWWIHQGGPPRPCLAWPERRAEPRVR